MSTLPRGICQVCGRTVAVTVMGNVRAHRTWRISPSGHPYTAADRCPGSGEPPDTAEAA